MRRIAKYHKRTSGLMHCDGDIPRGALQLVCVLFCLKTHMCVHVIAFHVTGVRKLACVRLVESDPRFPNIGNGGFQKIED